MIFNWKLFGCTIALLTHLATSSFSQVSDLDTAADAAMEALQDEGFLGTEWVDAPTPGWASAIFCPIEDVIKVDSQKINDKLTPYFNDTALLEYLKLLFRHELEHRERCFVFPTNPDNFCQHFAQFVDDYNTACEDEAGPANTALCSALAQYNTCLANNDGDASSCTTEKTILDIALFRFRGICSYLAEWESNIDRTSALFEENCSTYTSFGCVPPLPVPMKNSDDRYIDHCTDCDGC